jgi:hypothetical protein
MKSICILLFFVFFSGTTFSQGDPFPPEQPKKNPPQTTKPQAQPSYATSNSLQKYKSTRFGIYTFETEVQDYPDNVDIKKSAIPAIYYSGGKSINQYVTFNFEAFLHYTSFEVEYDSYSSLESKSVVINGGGGLQGEVRIPVPIDILIPYVQASLGYYHTYVDNSLKGSGTDFSYNYDFGAIYNTIGGGGIFMIGDNFGLFGEVGYIWTRTLKTLGEVTEDILEGQGYDPDYIDLDYPEYDEKIKGDNGFFKVGLIFLNPF